MEERSIKVRGMMCEHCEAHVKKALEKLNDVFCATASHQNGEVKIQLTSHVSDTELKAAIEEAGYEYIG